MTFSFDQSAIDEQILHCYFVEDETQSTQTVFSDFQSSTDTINKTCWNFNRQLLDTILAKAVFSIHVKYPMASKRLEIFRAMRLNWDIEEEIPATDETIDLAYKVLFQLKSVAEQSNVELPEPYVYLLSDGQIEFEWELNGKELDLAIAEENSFAVFSSLAQPSEDSNIWIGDEEKVLPEEVCQLPSVQMFLSWL